MFSFVSALRRSLKDSVGKSDARKLEAKRRRRGRLSVEALEARRVLTGFLVNTLDDVVAVDEFISLREAVQAANTNTPVAGIGAGAAPAGSVNGDSIAFGGPAVGGTIVLTQGQLTISDDLRISGVSGNSTTIDANDLSRIFNITTAEQVTLTDLVLRNGMALGGVGAGDGGAILNGSGPLTITNVAFTGNDATGSGGGIFNGSGKLTVANSAFTGNTAVRAGGGIELTTGTIVLSNVTMSSNQATGGAAGPGNGGAVHVTGNAFTTVIGGQYSANIVANEGGALWNSVSGTMVVRSNTLIQGNTALGIGAANGGGGIFNNGGPLTISTGVTIDNNLANGTQGSGGGIFSKAGIVNISGSTISNNMANRAGGGIEVIAGTINLSTTLVTGNSATGAGAALGNGGGLHSTGNAFVVIKDADFTLNTAAEEGGGLWNSATGTLIIEQLGANPSVIDSNTASGPGSDQGGGGIFNNGGTFAVNNSTVSNNVANGTAGSGGGILTTGGRVTIFNSTISGNTADRAGGGIEIINGDMFVQQTRIGGPAAADTNTATGLQSGAGNGGGIHVTGNTGTNVLVYNSSIVQGNYAEREGGGLWNQAGSRMQVFGGTQVIGNEAAGNVASIRLGGGIFNNGGRVDISDAATLIDGNSAEGTGGQGGGIFNAAGSTLNVTAATISNNEAQGNAATDGGGGIYNAGGTVTITGNAIVRANRATGTSGSGGGVFSTSGNVTVVNSVIDRNTANRAGGGIEVRAGLVNLNGVTLGGANPADGNIAGGAAASPGNGGGLHTSLNATVNVTGGVVQSNSATNEGGGLWNSGTGLMNVSGIALILDNVAATGGGIFNNGGGLTVNGTQVASNLATAGDGGGVRSTGGTIRIQNSIVDLNTSSGNGGGVKVDAGAFFGGGTLISNNVANGAVIGVGVGGGVFTASGAITIGQGTLTVIANTPDDLGGGGVFVA